MSKSWRETIELIALKKNKCKKLDSCDFAAQEWHQSKTILEYFGSGVFSAII